MKRLLVGALALSCSTLLFAYENFEKYDPHIFEEDPMKLTMPEDVTPATMIAYSGHGMYFDHVGEPIKVDDELVVEMERSMSEQLLKSEAVLKELPPEDYEVIMEAQKLVASNKFEPVRRAVLQGSVTSRLLQFADIKFREHFNWRHRLLMRRYTPITTEEFLFDIFIFERFRRLRDALRHWIVITPSTDYVERCGEESVPIPPEWSLASPNGWEYHDQLVQNLLVPGGEAHLWTWTDPHKKGACILLPRETLSGILCQSYDTGKACIWDNLHRTTGAVIPWRTDTLNVNKMQDGDMLASNCTGCHRGNNAYLISPDDVTWEKVLRASAPGLGANFTTNIAPSITRYEMISNQPGWGNVAGAQCIGCHERPTVGFSSAPAPMPANCATGLNPSNCYTY